MPDPDEDESSATLGESAPTVLVGIVAGSALALAAETYIARSLSPDVYGALALAYTLIYGVSMLAGHSIGDAVARTLSGVNGHTPGQILASGLVIAGGLGLALIGGGYLAREQLAQLAGEPALARYLPWLLPIGLVYPAGRVFDGMIQADTNARAEITVRHLLPRTAGILVLGAGSLAGASLLGAVSYWLLYPLGILAGGVGYLVVGDRLTPTIHWPDRRAFGEVWGQAWPLAASASMFTLLSSLDVLMIGVFASSQEVGYYRAIRPLRQSTTFLLSAFSFAFLPMATRQFDNDRIGRLGQLFGTSTKWVVTATLPLTSVFVLYPEAVVHLLYGPTYSPAAPALAALAGGLFVRTLTGLDGDLVKAIDRPRVELWTGAIGVAGNVLVNAWLIPRLGIVGAAIGTAVGYGVYNLLELAAIYRATGIQPFSWAIVRIATLVGATAAAIRWLTGPDVGVFTLSVVGVLVGIVAVCALLVGGDLTTEEMGALRRLEQRTGVSLAWMVPGQPSDIRS